MRALNLKISIIIHVIFLKNFPREYHLQFQVHLDVKLVYLIIANVHEIIKIQKLPSYQLSL